MLGSLDRVRGERLEARGEIVKVNISHAYIKLFIIIVQISSLPVT